MLRRWRKKDKNEECKKVSQKKEMDAMTRQIQALTQGQERLVALLEKIASTQPQMIVAPAAIEGEGGRGPEFASFKEMREFWNFHHSARITFDKIDV